ncbi:MAG TPA: Tim44-like domain-containing protein [Thermoanaerobaculia bacterium]|nr:Tim44-like domain-containing protein [Thermoanaerobaculia bacterium]
MKRRPWLAALLLLVISATFAVTATARVGGGQSYGGGSSSGGGSGGGGGGGEIIFYLFRFLFWLTFHFPLIGIPVDIVVIYAVYRYLNRQGGSSTRTINSIRVTPGVAISDEQVELDALRRFDPNFSEIVFTDFCYALYARSQYARGSKGLANLAPYLSEPARQSLDKRNPPGLKEVRGVLVGAFRFIGYSGIDTPTVTAAIELECNYTELVEREGREIETTWYTKEQWRLERARDILSPVPDQAGPDRCPNCGSSMELTTEGNCRHCGVRVENGAFQWFVQSIVVLDKENRGPQLTGTVPEVGTDLPTRFQPRFATAMAAFEAAHPDFKWEDFDARVTMIARELQSAWSSLEWERARPHETDNLFQMHRYWITAYQRQSLRNVVDDFTVARIEPVRISDDAFYDSITVRIFASGRDYTIDSAGKVVAGSRTAVRSWTEYWTFIRSRGRTGTIHGDLNCPNCGAALKVNAAGICSYCNSKITSGDFDWVLSKIEQDEAYG